MSHTPARPVLVVGSSATPRHLMDLKMFAFDVADRLRVPAVVSPWADDEVPHIDFADYSAIVAWDDWKMSLSSAYIVGMSAVEGVPFYQHRDIYQHAMTEACVHCMEREDGEAQPEPQWIAGVWTVALCKGCAPHYRRAARARQRAASPRALAHAA